MSEFSSQWLAMREPADHRSRNKALREQLNAMLTLSRTSDSPPLRIIDLGSGTGSNLRGLAPHLDGDQHWTLIDYDPKLIEAAGFALKEWADSVESSSNPTLHLKKLANTFKSIFYAQICLKISKRFWSSLRILSRQLRSLIWSQNLGSTAFAQRSVRLSIRY